MSVDQPLPISVQERPLPIEQETEDMGTLHIGSTISVPDVAGRWNVWSQTSETPGGYFVVPVDDAAKAIGAKYLVIKATLHRGEASPVLKAIRSDPSIKGIGD